MYFGAEYPEIIFVCKINIQMIDDQVRVEARGGRSVLSHGRRIEWDEILGEINVNQ